jgi:hypothetical protein
VHDGLVAVVWPMCEFISRHWGLQASSYALRLCGVLGRSAGPGRCHVSCVPLAALTTRLQVADSNQQIVSLYCTVVQHLSHAMGLVIAFLGAGFGGLSGGSVRNAQYS